MKANIFVKITERDHPVSRLQAPPGMRLALVVMMVNTSEKITDLPVSRLQAPPGMRNGLTSPMRNLVLVVIMMVNTSEKIGDMARNFNRNKVMNMMKSLVAVAIMVNTHEGISRKAKPDIKSQ
jgi:hypothetical protein